MPRHNPRPPYPPRLDKWTPLIYGTNNPAGLAAWLRLNPALSEWDKAGKRPGSIEYSRFYLRREWGTPPTHVAISKTGAVQVEGPDADMLCALLDELVTPPARPAPRPTRAKPAGPPEELLALADIAGERLEWPCDAGCVKHIWRKATLVLHPDAGGDHESFIAGRRLYEDALAQVEARR